MKTFSRFIICLILIALLSGCGSDQYSIEREHWYLQKQAEKITKNPAGSPPNELQKVVSLMHKFIAKYSKSGLALNTEFDIARLYMVKEEYENARAQLNSIVSKFSAMKAICSEAIYFMGYTYEKQEKWSQALTQYKKIISDYPITRRGMGMPMYIAEYYKAKYQPEKMIAAFKEAIAHYDALAKASPDIVLAYSAQMLAANCYAAIKDWTNAISSLNTIIEKYKGKINADGILMNIAIIYSKELKDKTKAKEVLERLVKEYPKSKLAKTAAALLKKQGVE